MSDELHLAYVRWSGQDRSGKVKLGDFGWNLRRVPLRLRMLQFFDLWFEPGLQEEIRRRPCDPKDEITAEERRVLADYLKAVGDWARGGKDVVEG